MKYAPFVIAAIVLIAATYVEGTYSDRWGRVTSDKLKSFSARLKHNVPYEFGDWKGVDDQLTPEKEAEFKESNCDEFISRTYRNREGQTINVYLVSGTARHVTIHTPDWCYVGAGFKKHGDPQQYEFANVNVAEVPEFLTARFTKETSVDRDDIRIFWGFTDDGNWQGPKMPKPAFAGRTALYKMYLITHIDGKTVGIDVDSNPTNGFVRDFLPVVNKALFETEAPAAAVASNDATE